MTDDGSRVAPKFEKHRPSRMPHPPYWQDINPCGAWLSGLLKRILSNPEFNSINEIEEAIPEIRNSLTFDDVQIVFLSWMKPLVWVIGNHGEHIRKENRFCLLKFGE
jgi:hypothetical protein